VRYLLDTHTLVWWLMNDDHLSQLARVILSDGDNEVMVSAVSAFELATKYRLGKWPEVGPISADFVKHIMAERFTLLAVETSHALYAGQLTADHKDPFDRLLAAQAKLEGLTLVSANRAFDSLDGQRLW
jgi:PIN domain nuclease of toxin-antitoxin system